MRYECFSLKKVKNDNTILVGDVVNFNEDNIITNIEKRKNKLIRPFVVNITQLFIVICETPETDFVLVDKLMINAIQNNIKPIILINKSDLNSKEYSLKVRNLYKFSGVQILEISTKTKQNFDKLYHLLENNLTCLAGQSAVGKSSLLNALTGENQRVNEYSKKLRKGKNTTTDAEIFVINDNSFLIDTPGFSQIKLNLKPLEVKLFYPEFKEFNCKFSNCSHTIEGKFCEVLINSESEKLSRLELYKKIYFECLNEYNNRY